MQNYDLRKFLKYWYSICPIDKWWREKYNVSFNSPTHRATSFIDMYLDFIDEMNSIKFRNKNESDKYLPGNKNIFKKIVYTEEQLDDMYDSIDIEKM